MLCKPCGGTGYVMKLDPVTKKYVRVECTRCYGFGVVEDK